MNETTHPPKRPSLVDYLVRHDLAAMIEEARLDYSQTSPGAPRHLTQTDIAARFRVRHRPNKAPHE